MSRITHGEIETGPDQTTMLVTPVSSEEYDRKSEIPWGSLPGEMPYFFQTQQRQYKVEVVQNTQSLASIGTAAVFEDSATGPFAGLRLGYLGAVPIALPLYPLNSVHRFLLSNPWHYACVSAKATATTDLGFTWASDTTTKRGVSNTQWKRLMAFEEQVYSTNQQDLSGVLKTGAIDYYSSGNMFFEVQLTDGNLLDSIYAVPAVTCFRHPFLPLVAQIPAKYDGSSLSLANNQFEPSAVLALFMSGIDMRTPAIQELIPMRQRTLAGRSEMVLEANYICSSDPLYGIGDIIAGLPALLGDNAAAQYNLQFFENNAVPRYAVTISGGRVTASVVESIGKFLDREIKRQNHRTIVIPLPRGFTAEFKALDSTPNEGSFLNYKKINREEIAAIHKVPPSEIGLWESANKANASQQSKNYFTKVIKPNQAILERMMNRIIRKHLGITKYTFKFNNVEFTDDQEKATVLETQARAKAAEVNTIKTAIEVITTYVEKSTITEEVGTKMLNKLVERLVAVTAGMSDMESTPVD